MSAKATKLSIAALFGVLCVALFGASWKMFEFRDRLLAITDNSLWETRLAENGAYNGRRIVFFGDSQIAKWPMAESFGVLPILNRGIVGAWASKAVDRFDRDVISAKPDEVVLLIGTNDLGNHQPVETIIGSIEKMIAKAQQHNIRVILCSLLPARYEYVTSHANDEIVAINQRLAALSQERGIEFSDLYHQLVDDEGLFRPEFTVDGLHANSDGYLVMTRAIRPFLTTDGAKHE